MGEHRIGDFSAKGHSVKAQNIEGEYQWLDSLRAEMGLPPVPRHGMEKCEVCGGKRHIHSGRLCKNCYKSNVAVNQSIRAALVAQRKERRIPNPEDVGSIPIERPNHE